MLTPILAALAMMLAEAPAATPTPAPAPAPAVPAAPAAPTVDPVTAEIDALMAPYKGKSGDRLRGLLGFSAGTRAASDGEVVFWMINVEQETACGMDPATMAMRCIRGDPFQCRLAIAFDKQSIVKAWAVTGRPEICRGFVGKLKAR
ncbi:MAG: hypothetical protein Q7T19_01405 [Caulobacter sp.]|nr:hypothetical protein [Caulobacter sp.]